MYVCMYVCNPNPTKTAHSEIFIRTILFECSDLEKKVISSTICNLIIILLGYIQAERDFLIIKIVYITIIYQLECFPLS